MQYFAFAIPEGEKTRANIPNRRVSYGASERQHLDIFGEDLPADSPIFVFVHGGYWSAGDNNAHSYIANQFYKNKIVTVMPEYDLCPNVKITEISQQIKEAVEFVVKFAVERGCKKMVIAGHSAGG